MGHVGHFVFTLGQWSAILPSHTNNETDEADSLWRSLIVPYSGEISDDTMRIIVCDICMANRTTWLSK